MVIITNNNIIGEEMSKIWGKVKKFTGMNRMGRVCPGA
jgi:hypothetical protein